MCDTYLQVAAVDPQITLRCVDISSKAQPPAPARLPGGQGVRLRGGRSVPVNGVVTVLNDVPALEVKPAYSYSYS